MLCAKCGLQNEPGITICAACGAELKLDGQAEPPASPAPFAAANDAAGIAQRPKSAKKPPFTPGAFAGFSLLTVLAALLIYGGVMALIALRTGMSLGNFLPGSTNVLLTLAMAVVALIGVALVALINIRGKRLLEILPAVVVLLVVHNVYAAPVFSPAPLALYIPADTTFFASIDTMNFVSVQSDYIKAVGRDRLMKQFDAIRKAMNVKFDMSAQGVEALKLTAPWVTRETLLVEGNAKFMFPEPPQAAAKPGSKPPAPAQPEFAMLIGSHNMNKTEENFPKILELGKTAISDLMAPTMPADAKELKDFKIQFTSDKHGDAVIHCSKPEKGPVPAKNDMNFCWASTKHALILASSHAYLERLIDSMNAKPTARQQYFTAISRPKTNQRCLVYMYLNSEPIIAEAKTAMRGDKDSGKLFSELNSVDGIEMTFGYDGLSPDVRLSMLVNQKNAANSKYIKKVAALKGSGSRLDQILNNNAVAYVSVSNIPEILKIVRDLIGESGPNALAELNKELGFSLDDIGNVIGEEAGIALLDLKYVKAKSPDDIPANVKLIAAVELNKKNNGKQKIIGMLKNLVAELDKESKNRGEIVLAARGSDVYALMIKGMPEKLQPCFGFTDDHMYITLDAATMNEYKGKNLGKSTGVSYVAQFTVNPSRLAGFAGDFSKAELAGQKAHPNPYMDKDALEMQTKMLDFSLAMMKAYGIGTAFFDVNDNKITLGFRQQVNPKALAGLPFEMMTDTFTTNFVSARDKSQYTACLEQLSHIKTGAESYLSENNDLTGVTADSICNHVLAGYQTAAACKGQVAARVAAVCDNFTFKPVANDAGALTNYEITGNARDSKKCGIMVTEIMALPVKYSDCKAAVPAADHSGGYQFDTESTTAPTTAPEPSGIDNAQPGGSI